MEFERLREFTAVARLGSVTKAAEELCLSPATLSARLIRFEEQLGGPLFDRSPAGMALTERGKSLLPRAQETLEAYDKVLRDISATRGHYYRRLRIAVSGTNLPLYLGPFLDQLNRTYPDIQLDILDDSRWGIVDGLRSGSVDVYFAPVMADFQPQGLVRQPMSPSSQYVLLPRSHPLSDRTMVDLRELDGERFLLYPKTAEPAFRDFQLRNLADSGVRYTLYESDTAALFYKLLVPVGKGLLLLPSSMMDLPPNTVCLALSGLPHPASNCFFYDGATLDPDVLAFVRDIATFAKEVVRHEFNKAL